MNSSEHKNGFSAEWQRSPLLIPAVYLFFGTLWILIGDSLTHSLEASFQTPIQSLKGLFFVLFSSFMIYMLVRAQSSIIKHQIELKNELSEKLNMEHELLFSIFEKIPDFIIVSDGESIYRANSAFLDFFEYKDVDGFKNEHKCICDFFEHGERGEYLLKDMDGVRWLEHVRSHPDRVHRVKITKNGKSNIFAISAKVLPVANNSRMLVIFRNITEIETRQRALEESMESMRVTIESVGDGFIATDTDGYVTIMNPIAQKLTGYSFDESKGRHISEVFHIVNAHTRAQVVNPVDEVIKKGIIVGMANHTLLISKSGKEYQISDSGAPIKDAEGIMRGVVLIFRDVTSEYFKSYMIEKLFENSRAIIVTLDEQAKILNFNPYAEELTGYSKDEVVGKNWIDIFIPKEEKDDIETVFSEVSKNINPHHGKINPIICKDGTKRVIQWRNSVLHEDSNINLSIGMDITEILNMQNEAKKLNEIMLLQSRQAAMGEMISMIAHQWRQPLSVANMVANNIRSDIEFGEIKKEPLLKGVTEISKQIAHMSETIDDFRDFFKPEKQKEQAEIQKVFKATYDLVKSSFENDGIRLEYVDNTSAPITMMTYPRELMQVLINLLNNAKGALANIKKEEKRVVFTLEVALADVKISVSDNGEGVSDEIKSHIFEPYFTTKESSGGSGLGLYISKTIIEKHLHGTIILRDSVDGACFVVNLPMEGASGNPS